MRQQTRPLKEPAEKVVQDIRRATRKHYSAEEKIRIVLEGCVARTALPSCVAARWPLGWQVPPRRSRNPTREFWTLCGPAKERTGTLGVTVVPPAVR